MFQCGKCGNEVKDGSVCPKCHCDGALDYEHYMTAVSLPEKIRQSYENSVASQQLVALGLQCISGENGVPDYKKAAAYFLRAAGRHNGRAHYLYGVCCHLGLGTEKNLSAALDNYKYAYWYDYADGAAAAGDCYINGWGVNKNEKKAVQWYRKGADAGSQAAAAGYGRCLENGIGIAKDVQGAKSMYLQAALQGKTEAIGLYETCGSLGTVKAYTESCVNPHQESPVKSHPESAAKSQTEYIIWKDKIFEQYICAALKCPLGKVTQQDLKGITSIYINNVNTVITRGTVNLHGSCDSAVKGKITVLEDMKWFADLESLFIIYHDIKDLYSLQPLPKLSSLKLPNNHIQSIGGIGKLTGLKKLNLAHNEISDIRPLAELKELEVLDLFHNRIFSITVLAQLKRLSSLRISRNRIQTSELKILGLLKYAKALTLDDAFVSIEPGMIKLSYI